MHSVAAGTDNNPNAPRARICRHCATEVLLWGLREWWIRERQKGHLDAAIANRPDCEQGQSCGRQKDLAHAKEYNHLISTSTSRSVQVPGPSADLAGQLHQTETRHSEPDPVVETHIAWENVHTEPIVGTGATLTAGSGADDRPNTPVP